MYITTSVKQIYIKLTNTVVSNYETSEHLAQQQMKNIKSFRFLLRIKNPTHLKTMEGA